MNTSTTPSLIADAQRIRRKWDEIVTLGTTGLIVGSPTR
jgi:hypothetical protein